MSNVGTLEVTYQLAPAAHLDLPIEVRRRKNFMLVARSRTGKLIEVAPGEYLVLAHLPDGQELSREIQIRENEPQTITLTATPTEGGHEATTSARAHQAAPNVSALYLISGNLLRDDSRFVQPYHPDWKDGAFRIPGQTGPRLLIWRTADRVASAVVPAFGDAEAEIRVTPDKMGRPQIVPCLVNPQGQLLLEYVERGAMEGASQVASSPLLDARKLLERKRSDVVAGALGAYVLLRFQHSHEDLEDRTRWLLEYHRGLPDAWAIRAEYLARKGQDKEAAELLLGLAVVGLPVFSDGVTFAMNRLRRYRDWPELIGHTNKELADDLLARLGWFAARSDVSRVVLSFPVLDVSDKVTEKTFFAGTKNPFAARVAVPV